jgi:RNA polymerase sigma-70 factor (ECF subfamily)
MGRAEALRMTDQEAVPEVSEALLVRRARGGDMAAFEALYRRHSGRVNALCLRMTGDRGKAEDCVQEAFVQAWRRIGSFEGRSAFGTWLHRIAVNQVLSMQRKEARRPGFLEVIEDRTEEPDPSRRSEDGGLQMDLEGAVASLPDGARNVFVLSAVHGYSHEETAGMLGVAVGTCKAQLHRARRLLAQRLDR